MKYKNYLVINENTESKKHYFIINIIVTTLLTYLLYALNKFNILSILNMSTLYFASSLTIFVLTLVFHEIIHIFAFKYFGKGKAIVKVEINMKTIIVKQLNKDLIYSRNEFVIILLLPYVLITLIFILLSLVINKYFIIFYFNAIFNSLASIIDIGISLKLLTKCENDSKVKYFFDNSTPIIKVYNLN